MKNILFIATVDEHILSFHIPYIKLFKEQGYDVHVASKGNLKIPYIDKKYNISFSRSPINISNFNAYRELKAIIDKNNYSLIHCHTPVGGAIGRLASRNVRKSGTKVLYTAHGFHFYQGAPLRNWILYYPIEKWLSKYTDCLITINGEDYNTSINKKFKTKDIKMVYGVGVDLNEFEPQTLDKKIKMRKEYDYEEDEFILFYAAELNANKNQDLLIDTMNVLKNKIPNIKLLLAGTGTLENQYKEKVKQLELENNIEFLGYCNDINNLFMISDIAVASSKREGLPVNVMEAMATGLALVVTNVRGHRDLVISGKNGHVIELDDIQGFATSIEKLYKDGELRDKFGRKSIELVQKYSIEKVLEEMKNIYNENLINR